MLSSTLTSQRMLRHISIALVDLADSVIWVLRSILSTGKIASTSTRLNRNWARRFSQFHNLLTRSCMCTTSQRTFLVLHQTLPLSGLHRTKCKAMEMVQEGIRLDAKGSSRTAGNNSLGVVAISSRTPSVVEVKDNDGVLLEIKGS